MTALSRLGAFARSVSNANSFATLFSMSDAELARRGLSRQELQRSYIASLGAQ
ncbi:MAG: hypothetical protein AAF771_06795 [Pseudomonadota bacterium]